MDNSESTTTRTEKQVFSDNLKKDEAHYLELRDKLVETGRRLEKHQKTAMASQNEATDAGAKWRESLRSSGGDITKNIQELKRSEVAARETAQEFATLVAEIEPIFEDLQVLTCRARAAYITSFERADRFRLNCRAEDLAGAVFATEQGQELAALLMHLADQVKSDAENDPAIQELFRAAPQGSGISVDEAENEFIRVRAQGLVYRLIERHGRKALGQALPVFKAQPIPPGPFELDQRKASTIAASQAAVRLKAAGFIE
jgi:hypothetical protein